MRTPARMPSQFRLDLSVTPGNSHEFNLWRNGMSPLFEMDALDASARSSFEVEMTSFQFASASIIHGRSTAASFERTAPMVARSELDNISVLMYAKGGCSLDIEGCSYEVEAGDICFIDMSRPSKLRAPDYESLTLILPREIVRPHIAYLDDLHGRILPKSSPLNAILSNNLRALHAEASALNVADGRAAIAGTAALIGAFAGPSEHGNEAIGRIKDRATLHSFRSFIEENLHNPRLSPETVCSHFGVSRAALYRSFEPMDGISQYIRRRRLARAYRMLSGRDDPDLRIGNIALRCGFSSSSVFSRAMRQAFGMSAMELRGTFKSASTGTMTFNNEGGFGTIGLWLLGLDGALSP
jgi:AraC-like DNA-binding protein